MINISEVIDAAAQMTAAQGITVYKTACPKDFTRPSLYIAATMENITFGMANAIDVVTTLTLTSYVALDENGDADGNDITDAAKRITNALVSAGGITVKDCFLKLDKIKNKTEKDSLKTIVKLSYNDAADVEEQVYETAQEVLMNSVMEEGRSWQ